MEHGEIVNALNKAAIAGTGFPSAVPDTPDNRKLYGNIIADIAEMPEGTVPEIPYDYTDE